MAETYYRKIKGKNYDRRLLELADASTSGKGDGRISLNDARAIFRAIKDSDAYTDIEKRTVQYIRDNYKFTDEADKWFRSEVRSWAATKKKPATKKPAAKKSSAKKAAPKKPAAKKAPAKKASSKKPAVKKAAARKTPAKKAVPEPFMEKPVMTEPEEQAALMAPVETPAKTARVNRMNALWLLLILILVVGVVYLVTYDGGMNLDPDRFDSNKTETVIKKPVDKTPVERKDAEPVKKPEPLPVPEKKALTPEGEAIGKIVIYFDKGLGWVAHDQKDGIFRVVEYLKKNPSDSIRITGHASAEGDSGLNSALALYRAKMVAKYIVSRGIDAKRISVAGMGDTEPAVADPSAGEERKNRRVEFQIY